ncbi:MAG: hypothetical protein HY319_07415 [Armatimonadetes bacterium]|nr:hypothetical protein [Armatimonadota bacterium]
MGILLYVGSAAARPQDEGVSDVYEFPVQLDDGQFRYRVSEPDDLQALELRAAVPASRRPVGLLLEYAWNNGEMIEFLDAVSRRSPFASRGLQLTYDGEDVVIGGEGPELRLDRKRLEKDALQFSEQIMAALATLDIAC